MSGLSSQSVRGKRVPETRYTWIREVQSKGRLAAIQLAQMMGLYDTVITGWCREQGLSQADAEILAQRILEDLPRKLAHYERQDGIRFRQWLHIVVINAAKTLRTQQGVLVHLGQYSGWQEDLVDRLAAQSFVVEREVEEAMTQARERVENRTWEAFEAVFLRGEKAKEVATQMGLTHVAVRMAVKRFLSIVKEEYQSQHPPASSAFPVEKKSLALNPVHPLESELKCYSAERFQAEMSLSPHVPSSKLSGLRDHVETGGPEGTLCTQCNDILVIHEEVWRRVTARVGPQTWGAYLAFRCQGDSSKAVATLLGFGTPDAVRMAIRRVEAVFDQEYKASRGNES